MPQAKNGSGGDAAAQLQTHKGDDNSTSSGPQDSSPDAMKIAPYNDDPDLPLYTIDQAPKHLSDNIYILTGYRVGYTARMCARSILALHNETFNIWTHLIGFVVFLFVIGWFFVLVLIPSSHQQQNEDALVASHTESKGVTLFLFAAYSFGCLMCMLCSSLFHTLLSHKSATVYSWVHALDYFGITFLVVGSFLPFCYFSFACEPLWRWAYLSMISSLGAIGLLGPFFRQWTQQQYANSRTLFYVCMVSSGLFPITHIYFLLPGTISSSFVKGLLLMMTLYGVGVFVYAFRIPEFFFPGKFDLYLSSHQIWHVLVLAAAFVHFFNSASMYVNFRRMELSC
ncbi:adiponectin receptor protein 1 [Trypanosoma rangeli]|uniref:Adiponectin receptor protein 1 n=1 Tax=Trypanosoma rangeli TaxID=5698 RepID=A0A3R7L1Y6_TRYRA|nr:adiponectin receptor protein 1 [Trypanosoma rangeli]RNF05949.1 adiponectin receptor protein 1 [Trypanosoma rangeli]|eukprot:RNF05949.1 adiponectin receptor protein 1 [Trypanosoma rangeli]